MRSKGYDFRAIFPPPFHFFSCFNLSCIPLLHCFLTVPLVPLRYLMPSLTLMPLACSRPRSHPVRHTGAAANDGNTNSSQTTRGGNDTRTPASAEFIFFFYSFYALCSMDDGDTIYFMYFFHCISLLFIYFSFNYFNALPHSQKLLQRIAGANEKKESKYTIKS